MKCFYHNDADGHCAAHWVNVSYSDLYDEPDYDYEYIEMTYSTPFPIESIRKDEVVYIVDFSISPDEMRELLKITKNVTWIDHHITAIEKYKDFEYDIRGVRYDGVAACMLTYCYLNHMTDGGHGEIKPFEIEMSYKAPFYTELIADWDVWTFDFGNLTKAFITAFNAEDTHPLGDFWSKVDYDFTQHLIGKGFIMLEYRDGYMKDYTKLGFEVEFEGYRCFAMNIGHANSEFFKSIDDGSYDIFMPFVFDGSDWTLSMYSKGDVDVSEIAKKYGGGGHKNAAGFHCDELPWIKSIVKK